MYSTNIKDNRFSILCLAVLEKKFALNAFIVDTGAMITCCKYKFIDKNLQEEDVADSETEIIGGLVRDSAVKFYRYSLKQFTIGNIDMGK